MHTDTGIVACPATFVPIEGPLGLIARMLESEMLGGPTPQAAQPVRDAMALVPVATAAQVRWRHVADLDGVPVIAVIADALDGARCRMATARAAWPLTPLPMIEQCAALESARAELRAAADLLEWAFEMANGDGITLEVNVTQVSPHHAVRHPDARLTRASIILRT